VVSVVAYVPTFHRILGYENQLSSFCVILLTNKQTDADESVISLAEVRNTNISLSANNGSGSTLSPFYYFSFRSPSALLTQPAVKGKRSRKQQTTGRRLTRSAMLDEDNWL